MKTPGGRLKVQYVNKRSKGPKCGDCGGKIHGVPSLLPMQLARVNKRVKTVTRAYGGSRCGSCVKNRILRSFLIEEQKAAQKVQKLEAARATSKKAVNSKEVAKAKAKAKDKKAKQATRAARIGSKKAAPLKSLV